MIWFIGFFFLSLITNSSFSSYTSYFVDVKNKNRNSNHNSSKRKNLKKKKCLIKNTLTRIECDKYYNIVNVIKTKMKKKTLLSYDFFNCIESTTEKTYYY